MEIALACGGTGGHIFPGLATADILRERGHEVVLWLAGKDVESDAVRGWSGGVHTVPAEGLPGQFSPKTVGVAWRLLKAASSCTQLMRREQPDVLLAMGSYASVGPVCAALRLHVPVVLHEANVLPGRTIALFSRWASSVAASFEETRYYMRRKNLVVTGMPLRRELARAAHADLPGQLDRNLFTLLVMGGSRGATRLNELASQAVVRVHAAGAKLQVVHLAGSEDADGLRARYQEAGVTHTVHSFTSDMGEIYGATDLAICRAGASTCAELSAFGVPALLIPYPHAAKDHQMVNARAMEKAGAADVVAEKDVSEEWLSDYLADGLSTPERLANMSASSKKRAMQRGAEALADVVEKAATEKSA